MLHKIFTIHDVKADAYYKPFFFPNKAMAIREFTNLVNDKNSQVGTNPADYTLFALGEFDDNKAEFSEMKKTSIGNGVEFLYVDEN